MFEYEDSAIKVVIELAAVTGYKAFKSTVMRGKPTSYTHVIVFMHGASDEVQLPTRAAQAFVNAYDDFVELGADPRDTPLLNEYVNGE